MYLQELRFANIRGFSTGAETANLDFKRPDGSYAGWTVLAGRNGTGKTTLLRAIALALSGPSVSRSLVPGFSGWVSHHQDRAHVHAAFSVGLDDTFAGGGQPPKRQPWAGLSWERSEAGPEPAMSEDLPPSSPKMTPRRGPWNENPSGWFLVGYGPFRRLTGAASEAQRQMLGQKRVAGLVTLFDESASLAESSWWLQDLYPRVLEKDPQAQQLLSGTLALLNDGLLPDGFRVSRYDSNGLWVEREGSEVVLEEMSDGYRTVAALVIDLTRRLAAFHGSSFKIEVDDGPVVCSNEGVVLIDEVDVHLHVRWQQEIGFWLQTHFPRIQFIVSTHSPFICQAASPGGLVRLPAPSDADRAPRIVANDLYEEIVFGSADRAVTTELFGLESPFSQPARELRSELMELEVANLEGEVHAQSLDRLRTLRERLSLTPSEDVAAALRSVSHLTDGT